ncbi:hypothetical protein SRHO_G00008300 [Serrasalmus rhombeus]
MTGRLECLGEELDTSTPSLPPIPKALRHRGGAAECGRKFPRYSRCEELSRTETHQRAFLICEHWHRRRREDGRRLLFLFSLRSLQVNKQSTQRKRLAVSLSHPWLASVYPCGERAAAAYKNV